jgi:hypothetical protein
MCGSTFGVSSGKWYWEAITENGSGSVSGIHKTQPTGYAQIVGYNEPNGYGYSGDGNKLNNNTGTAYGATYTTGDVIGIALDMDAGTLTFYKNNTSQGVAFSGLSGTFMPAFSAAGPTSCNANFGQQGFVYTPPSGFVALNTYNLSTPTIPNGAVYMAATTYTGNGSTQSIVNTVNGTFFQPDLVWVKVRSSAATHGLIDSVRGAGIALASNLADAERNNGTGAGGDVIAFNSNGFNLGNNTTGSATNSNLSGSTYIGWQWKVNGGSTVTNTSGTITSTVSANTTAGFSIATFSGASGGTVGHGLGVAPQMIFIKSRTTATGWYVYTSTIGANGWLVLETNAAAVTGNSAAFGGTPTSTVWTYGAGLAGTGNYVAYAFTPIAGYSAFGSYTGNGSADGAFVYLGFRPRFIIVKNTSGADAWQMWDTTRTPYNVANGVLYASLTTAETSSGTSDIDILSSGFKIRTSNSNVGTNGATYIYMAFAENPFKYSNAR